MTLGALMDRLLKEAANDWVGVWELPWIAKSMGRAADSEEVLQLSLQIIREALENGLAEVGDVTDTGFRPWGVSTDEACLRIEHEWRRFPNGPRLGDMSCWINLTERGRERLDESGSTQGQQRT
jgi:hypothetical protein